jgi:uncharacterized repeat protein (TIGR03803 family)
MANGGGYYSGGTVFEVSPNPRGNGWVERALHNFGGTKSDGTSPQGASLIIDADGNLYGTTTAGGVYDEGVAFKLSRTTQTAAVWTEEILYSFGKWPDAQNPSSGLIFDSAGNLFGATVSGGRYGCGAAYEISPSRVE